MTIKRGILQVAAVIIIVSLAGYLLGLAINGNEASEETLELLAELYSIFISFSIFGVTWYAYSKSRDNHALFMGAAFLVIGFIDLFHTLSYTFMPDFITSNTPGKSAAFWNMARVISAPLLLASAYIFKDSLPALINKPVLSVSAIVISVISLISGVFYHDYMPAAYHEEGISFLRIIQVLATAIIILYAGYLYTRRRTEKNIELLLMYGFIIVVFSDLIYFSYEISGHLLKVAGFYFIYISLYKSSVELPYEKLAIAEEKLRHAAEEKYRNLFDNANDAIIIHDIEGRVISWNNAAEKIFGWTAQEITGKKLVPVIIPPERRVEVERTACSIVPGGLTGFELEFLRKDGSRIDGSLTVSHLRDAGGNVIGVSCIVRDITERKKAEQLRLENERLALANRAKSEFLSVMSHELRTPMNAVIGFSELLKGKMAGELNERQEHFIDNILKSGKRQLSLIEEILDLTLIEAKKLELTIEKVAVPETIEETLDQIKPSAASRNLLVKKELDPKLGFIMADRKRFKQILSNLLDNAVKFSKPEGGTVIVTSKKEGDMAKFSVSDTGIGIEEEDMGKLFKMFQQVDMGTSRRYGGTGIGLAITKQLVELHGGRIMAESKYGEGSTFTFSIPLETKKGGKNK